jgi:hypothetical protein
VANAVLLAYSDAADWQPVRSSNVKEVAYLPDFKYLFVRFHSGAEYVYETVPEGVYQGLLAAPSKGQYIYFVIRAKGTDSVYPFRRVR